MDRKEKIKQWLWYFSFPAAAVLLYKLYDNFGQALGHVGTLIDIMAPFVGGFVIAFLLYPPSNMLENAFLSLKGKAWPKLARPLALLITYLLFLGLITLLFWLIIPILIDSLTNLVSSLPEYLTAAQKGLQKFFSSNGILSSLNLQDTINGAYENLIETFTDQINADTIGAAVKGVGAVASSIINIVIALVVSIYMLSGREHLCHALRNFAGLFIRPRPLARMRDYAYRTGHIFSQYIYGAILDALIVGTVVSVGLAIFRVPYPILLGMILGVMNLVPYFGAIIGCAGIAFVTLLTNGFPVALGVTIYIIVAQQIDANIIQPRIIGDSMGLRPFYVLLSITFFGGIFGFWGILLGPPLMAVIQMVVRDIYARRHKKRSHARRAAKESEAGE